MLPQNTKHMCSDNCDCLIIDPALVDQCIEKSIERELTIIQIYFPQRSDGLDVEVIKFSALDIAHQKQQQSDREYVTPLLGINIFKKSNQAPQSSSHIVGLLMKV